MVINYQHNVTECQIMPGSMFLCQNNAKWCQGPCLSAKSNQIMRGSMILRSCSYSHVLIVDPHEVSPPVRVFNPSARSRTKTPEPKRAPKTPEPRRIQCASPVQLIAKGAEVVALEAAMPPHQTNPHLRCLCHSGLGTKTWSWIKPFWGTWVVFGH